MKDRIIKTAQLLEEGKLTELEARNLLLNLFSVSGSFNKLVEQFEKETEMTWFRSPNAFKKWVNER